MARLFIGIPLPDRLRARLREEADRLRLSGARVGWTHPDSYHVTVKFLGEVADRDLLEVHRVLEHESAGTGVLRLVAKGLAAVPEGPRPRLVWCGIDGETEEMEELLDLHRRLNRELRDLGIRRDKGPFQPHVTLGRVRDSEGVEALKERIGPSVRREFGHFTVPEVVLFESWKRGAETVYTPLQRTPLA